MKYLMALLVLLIANSAVAKTKFEGTWFQHKEDLGLLIYANPNGKAIGFLKTNSTCKPIFAKMRGTYKNNALDMSSEIIRLPDGCVLELRLGISVAFTRGEMKVVGGGITSIVDCNGDRSAEVDILKGQSFYRANQEDFFKPKKVKEI